MEAPHQMALAEVPQSLGGLPEPGRHGDQTHLTLQPACTSHPLKVSSKAPWPEHCLCVNAIQTQVTRTCKCALGDESFVTNTTPAPVTATKSLY